ncbi:MAG TPA: hypothetical protein VK175_12465 [Leadbetterella sp.]|nr:hypothetical protein [Leadbetterella sp.]
MNKYLAGYVFAGETLFNVKKDGLAMAPQRVVSEPSKPAQITAPHTTPSEQVKQTVQAPVYQKKLVLVVNALSITEKDLLTKIMQSVKRNIEDADIIDIANLPNAKLENFSSAIEIVSFGVAMSKLGSNLLLFPYQLQEKQSVRYLLVDDLKTIQANQKDEKRLLWAALKTFYGI